MARRSDASAGVHLNEMNENVGQWTVHLQATSKGFQLGTTKLYWSVIYRDHLINSKVGRQENQQNAPL